MEVWLEATIFLVLLFLVNAIILLVCWFSHTITSSEKSIYNDPLKKFMDLSERHSADGVRAGPDSFVAEALGSGRHKRPHRPPNYSNRWSSKQVSDPEDSSSDAEAHMTTALRAHCPNRNSDIGCALAMQLSRKTIESQRMVEEARLSHQEEKLSKQVEDSQVILRQHRSLRLTALSEDFNDANVCLATELQKLVEQEAEAFNQELQAIKWYPSSNEITGFSVSGTEQDKAENLMESSSPQPGSIGYRRYNALVSVGRFDPDYEMMGRQSEKPSDTKQPPGQQM